MASSVSKYLEHIKLAKAAEENGDEKSAASHYEQAIRSSPMEEQPYNRLMIIYRKLKEPEKELKVIDKALKVFMSHYDDRLDKFSGKDKLGQLSRALLKTVSGKSKPAIEYPQPVPKWIKRKEGLKKKLGKEK